MRVSLRLLQGLAGDPQGLELLELCLCYDPAKRISAADAMKHPYFDDIPGLRQEEDGANEAAQAMASARLDGK